MWKQLDGLKAKLGDGAPERADDNERDHFDRLMWLFHSSRKPGTTRSCSSRRQALDDLNGALAQMNAGVDQWRYGAGRTYLLEAGQTWVDGALNALARWPLTKDRYQRGLLRASLDFQNGTQAELDRLASAVGELEGKLAGFAGDYETLGANANTALDQLRVKIAEVPDDVETQTERLDSALNGLQANFTSAET